VTPATAAGRPGGGIGAPSGDRLRDRGLVLSECIVLERVRGRVSSSKRSLARFSSLHGTRAQVSATAGE
jgi:hypothetical protein